LSDNDLRSNTLLWYCGDNGTPGDGIVTSPFRGQKGNLYEGGIRVPGLIQWPQRITDSRASSMNTVTSDMLPTICEIVGVAVPDRPMDGISLKGLIDGDISERPDPICFWSFDTSGEANGQPYIDAERQQGTTPLVKMMGDLHTRNFRNFHHPEITPRDYDGSLAILGNRYKLVVKSRRGESNKELFDVRSDPGEESNLIETNPEMASQLEQQLRRWQQSVLQSLTGADYP
jgi:arylsulfatase A-like enzyme